VSSGLHEVVQCGTFLLAPADALVAIPVGDVQIGMLREAGDSLTLKEAC